MSLMSVAEIPETGHLIADLVLDQLRGHEMLQSIIGELKDRKPFSVH